MYYSWHPMTPYVIIVKKVAFYIAHVSIAQKCARRFNKQYFSARYVELCLNYETYSFYVAPCNGLQGAAANQTGNSGPNPFSF